MVAGMATMPSRKDTFPRALQCIVRQVDRLYLYLDGFQYVPAAAKRYPNVVPILSGDMPGLHANGKLIGLVLEEEPGLYACFDDDFHFRRDFVSKMRTALARYDDKAVVGLHGTAFNRPLEGYFKDGKSVSYWRPLESDWQVDALGTGAVLFNSRFLRFDVRNWPFGNMADLGVATEAARAGLPMIAIARRAKEVLPLAMAQPDSLRTARMKDDTAQTELARELLRLRDRPA